MEVATLNVENRSAAGSKQVRKLRDTGKIPLILYGGGEEPISLQADYVSVHRYLEHHLRVYKLHMGDLEQPGYLQHVQWDCLTDEPLHMDFRRIDMKVPLELQIEMAILGHPKGVSSGGRLVRDVPSLSLNCLPANVPESVEIRVGNLDQGDSILAKDLVLPEGCSLNMPEDTIILHIATEELEMPEPAEGEAVAAEEGAETPAAEE